MSEGMRLNGVNAAEQNKQYVLVVDSNVNDRLSTCMLLLRFGRNIFTANTTEEAIEFMSMAPPVAVVAEADPAGLTLLPRMQNDLRFLLRSFTLYAVNSLHRVSTSHFFFWRGAYRVYQVPYYE